MEELRLNRLTGKYELVFTLEVDAESMTQVLLAYVKRNNIDLFNPLELEQAKHAVTRFDHWKEHPHARIVLGGERQNIPSPETAMDEPEEHETRWASLTQEEKEALRTRALDLPVGEWDSLLQAIPDGLSRQEKQWYYQRRTYERKVLEALKAETAPNPLEQFSAIAEAMGSNSIH